ncbi:hypothetical protein ACIP79_01940 [Streptomyces sp. NPDC088747]|uniref:hypothetical protein n=1 Tax=Streptomyces sp. NPDC088747 TaxID=3365886 RepID=UPI00381937AB
MVAAGSGSHTARLKAAAYLSMSHGWGNAHPPTVPVVLGFHPTAPASARAGHTLAALGAAR